MSLILDALKDTLTEARNDGMLHFSQHLQHDRHTAIYMQYGYPNTSLPWGRMFPLIQGTAIHETIHAAMAKTYPKYVPEREITLPVTTDKNARFSYTWTGTADAYVEVDDTIWLLDYKTISGSGMSFLTNKPKPEHILQVSAYYHFGPTQNCKTAVVYFPTGPDYKRKWEEPRFVEFEPIPKMELVERMQQVEEAIHDYEEDDTLPPIPNGEYVWKKTGKNYKLQYRPHYTTMFCPWASLHDDPCGCSNEKTQHIAEYKNGELIADERGWEIAEEVGLPLQDDQDVL